MKQFNAHDHVDAGLYFNPRQLRFRSMQDAGPLPGEAGERFHRVPTWLMLVAGPLVGLVFLMFLPLIGLLMVGALVVRVVAGWLHEAAVAFGRVSRPAWRPVTAFLGRTRRARHGARHADQWSEGVKKRVASKPRKEG